MADFAARIEKQLRRSRKKTTGKQVFEDICFLLVKKGNMSVNDVVNSPTPFVLNFSDKLQKYYKDKEKAMKKASRR